MNKIIKTIIAIGGGELGKLDTLAIDKKIVKLSKKTHPKVLFIPTASNDAEGYCDTFQKVYGDKLHCQVDFLLLVRDKHRLTKKEIKQKILSADIIYVGGGSTLKMMKEWRKQGVDKFLKQAYRKGIILSGLSAGAICWFRYGVSDSRLFMKNSKNKDWMRVAGLNLFSLTISPEHIRDKKIRDEGIKIIMQRTPGVGLAMDDYTALVIQNNSYKIWHSRKNVGITKYFKKDKIIKKNLPSKGVLSDLILT